MACFAAAVDTALGPLVLAVDEAGALVSCEFLADAAQPLDSARLHTARLPDLEWSADACAEAVGELREYAEGRRRDFTLAVNPRGTGFQRSVWNELRRIPYGQTISYGELARRLGLSGHASARAVGAANGANPVCVVIPCHRVIGADGRLVGYAGGLELKRRLLEHEGALTPALF